MIVLHLRGRVRSCLKMYGIKGQLCKSNFMEWRVYLYFVMFFVGIYRVISLTDLSVGFIKTKHIILFRNHLAGPVNFVKLA